MSETDEFGLPLNWETLYETQGGGRGWCTHCNHAGHTEETCLSFLSTKNPCMNVVGPECFQEECIPICNCENCSEFRQYNLPDPHTAIANLKREESEEKRRNPITQITNDSEESGYIWEIDRHGQVLFRCMVHPNQTVDIYLLELIRRGEYRNLIVTSQDPVLWGDRVMIRDDGLEEYFAYLDDFRPNYILSNITVEYGREYEHVVFKRDTGSDPELSELIGWKKAALQTKYLLEQLDRLGASRNPNYEPIMDLIQDIDFPVHSEFDKDKAGLPSVLLT
jgi:hypothetical protein